MALFSDSDRCFAAIIDDVVYSNPFGRERLENERRALGGEFSDERDAWRSGPGHRNRNIGPLLRRVEQLLEKSRSRLPRASDREIELYKSLVRYRLYYEIEDALYRLGESARRGDLKSTTVDRFDEFQRRCVHYFGDSLEGWSRGAEVSHLFAIGFQLRRAFEEIFLRIVGASEPAASLRARVWESVFTHDMRRYERSLYDRMHLMNTLVVGPSGTGKELVARAIGLSRFVPFDAKTRRFREETHESFLPLNLSALSPHLVESELFGHKKGSFTGAISDRAGFLESCPEEGTVFLDEIGELSEELQVKLLRTLQARTLVRIGEQKSRPFRGKLVTATNRDLDEAVQAGRFREDFYYRLRADQVTTPSLRAQLEDRPDDLRRLVEALVSRMVPRAEVEELLDTSVLYIQKNLAGYPWPGNVRELEQCILSLIVHGVYVPAGTKATPLAERLGRGLIEGEYSLDEMTDLYVTLAYRRHGSYSETARQLELDWRTVKSKVKPALLGEPT